MESSIFVDMIIKVHQSSSGNATVKCGVVNQPRAQLSISDILQLEWERVMALVITMTSLWARWRLESPASRLFT